jgi:Xaa-Pro dipeptidase
MTVVEILPDDAALRQARRARVLAAMDADDVDFLIVGREGNARYVSGAPRLWTAGSRAFGPGCVFVRESGAVHLLSTWDEGIPEEIPHENLYGITFNAVNFVKVLSKIEGAATARRVATDSMSGSSANLLPKAFPAAEFIDGEPMLRQIRRVKSPEEVEAIRASVRVAEEALAAATHALVPGVTERQLTAIFMEAMAAAGVTTPSGQDVAWITSRDEPWRRTNRDTPAQPGDLVAFEAGVVLGGYSGELGRTYAVGEAGDVNPELVLRSDELWDRLLNACRVGAPLTDLLSAYDAAGVPPPPMPVARGLGLGFDLPLVTHALPLTAGEQHIEAGMV